MLMPGFWWWMQLKSVGTLQTCTVGNLLYYKMQTSPVTDNNVYRGDLSKISWHRSTGAIAHDCTVMQQWRPLWDEWVDYWILGDGFVGGAPAEHWVREAEAAVTGAPAVPGERVAARWTRWHAAATTAQRAAMCSTRRRTHTSPVHERDAEIWPGVFATGTHHLIIIAFITSWRM